jgi:hypothetical protein
VAGVELRVELSVEGAAAALAEDTALVEAAEEEADEEADEVAAEEAAETLGPVASDGVAWAMTEEAGAAVADAEAILRLVAVAAPPLACRAAGFGGVCTA